MHKQDVPMLLSGILLISHWLIGFLFPTQNTSFLLAIGAIIALVPIARKAYGSLLFKMASIELLVTIAVTGALFLGEYSEAAIVSFLFLFGAFLESRTIRKTRSAIEALLKLAPQNAIRIRDGIQEEVAIEDLIEGDIVVIKAGNRIPVDGEITHGSATVDQAQITGEPLGVDKTIGESVYASTILVDGYLEVKTQRIGETTVFGNIIKRLEEAQDKKAQTERTIEKFAAWYTPSVVVLSIVTLLISRDINLALTLLVIACPGAMVISIPVAIVTGIGTLAKYGILVKGGEAIEKLASIRILAFDKTGTLTQGKPQVTQIIECEADQRKILEFASIAEQGSSHALGKAILNKATLEKIHISHKADSLDVMAGLGIIAHGSFGRIAVGNHRMAKLNPQEFPSDQLEAYHQLTQIHPTCVYVSHNGNLFGYLIIEDTLRTDAKDSLIALHRQPIQQIHVITGDSMQSAKRILDELSIDMIHAEVLPQEKAEIIVKLKKHGKVAMIGDGINDTLALSESDAGIALSSDASEIAMKTADVVILGEDVRKVESALRISRFTSKILKQNIFISIGTVFFLIFGVLIGKIHMDVGMLVHEASVLAVILNALRIMRVK